MKAYKDSKGKVRLFRPDKNIERLNNSMTRLAMPPIEGNNGFLECLKDLIRLDESWVPDKEGYSLYIRPTAIGTSPVLGVHASEDVKLYAILSPVGPYYPTGFQPVKLLADAKNVRAWPGGVGNTKVGGNYAPTIQPSQEAAKKYGANQILWLYGDNHECTEVGAMNIFFVFQNKETGKPEIATAPLTRGDILPGVTRDSILQLARQWKDVTVTERWVTMKEIVDAQKNGTVRDISIIISIYHHPSTLVITSLSLLLLSLILVIGSLWSGHCCGGESSSLHRLQGPGHQLAHGRADRPTGQASLGFADRHPIRESGQSSLVRGYQLEEEERMKETINELH
jgi:branched-chain amino acid aminotransferase group II